MFLRHSAFFLYSFAPENELSINLSSGKGAFMETPKGIRPPTVYLVDDQAEVVGVITCFLKMLGFDARGFMSAEELIFGNPAPPACAIIDRDLGTFNGLELLAVCRKAWPDTALLMISGSTCSSFADQAIQRGARNVLSKPISPLTLAREVRQAIATQLRESMARRSLEKAG